MRAGRGYATLRQEPWPEVHGERPPTGSVLAGSSETFNVGRRTEDPETGAGRGDHRGQESVSDEETDRRQLVPVSRQLGGPEHDPDLRTSRRRLRAHLHRLGAHGLPGRHGVRMTPVEDWPPSSAPASCVDVRGSASPRADDAAPPPRQPARRRCSMQRARCRPPIFNPATSTITLAFRHDPVWGPAFASPDGGDAVATDGCGGLPSRARFATRGPG